MADGNKVKVSRWLRAQQAAGEADLIQLWHGSGKKGGAPVTTAKLVGVAEDLAAELVEAATDDAEANGGAQMYVLVAVNSGDTSDGLAKMSLRVAGGDVGEVPREEADSKHVVAHVLRHHEAMARMHSAALAKVQDTYQSIIDRTLTRNEHLEKQLSDSIIEREKMLSLQQERDLIRAQTERQEARKDQILKQLMLFAPGIVSKLLGKKPAPDGSTEAQLRDFIESLNEQQMAAVVATLTPEQVIALEQMANSIEEKEESK